MRIESGDPERMEFRSGGRTIVLLQGWMFLLFGLGLVSCPFWGGWDASSACLFIGGLLIATPTAFMLLVRSGAVIDRCARTVRTWWRILKVRSEERPLDDFDRVVIIPHVDSGNAAYPVRLAGKNEEIALLRPTARPEAFRAAKEIARFAALRLVDKAYGTPLVREAERLDESYVERARREGREVKVPLQPACHRLICQAQGETIRVERRPSRRRWWAMILTGLPVPIMTAAILACPRDRFTSGFETAFLKSYGLVCVLALFLGVSRFLLGTEALEVSSDILRLVEDSPFSHRAKEIPVARLENLEIVDLCEGRTPTWLERRLVRERESLSLLARSEKTAVLFGRGLSGEELRWLKAVIEKTLTA